MRERTGLGEGGGAEALRKQKARVVKAGALVVLGALVTALASNVFFVEVREYKQIKASLRIDVGRECAPPPIGLDRHTLADHGHDGDQLHSLDLDIERDCTIDPSARRDIEDQRHAAVAVSSRVSLASYVLDHLGPQPAYALIVNSGENWLVDAFQNLVEPETMIYHGSGTGTVAAAEGDVSLGAEITTGLNPDATRPSCAVVGEGASPNIRRCQATVSYDATLAVTEWGLFNQASTAGGTLFSRIVFSAVNVNSGDSIQFTYDLTVE